jgi:rubrerythrin
MKDVKVSMLGERMTKAEIKEQEKETEERCTFGLASGLHDQVRGEADAIKGYQEFLRTWASEMKPEDVDIVNKIVADEKGHTLVLVALAIKYDEVNPNAPELALALKTLTKL